MAKTIGETKNNKLQTLIEYHQIQRLGDAHRAMSDADACRQYYVKCGNGAASVPWTATGYEHSYTTELPELLYNLPYLIAAGQSLTFTYTDGKDETTECTIIPYGWAKLPTGVMFHGFCHLRQARRTFRTDRVQAVRA